MEDNTRNSIPVTFIKYRAAAFYIVNGMQGTSNSLLQHKRSKLLLVVSPNALPVLLCYTCFCFRHGNLFLLSYFFLVARKIYQDHARQDYNKCNNLLCCNGFI